MFLVVYELRIKYGFEDSFKQAWHNVTKALITENGSLGARLHVRDDGAFVAYAQWPNREMWQAQHHHIEETAIKMHLDEEFIEFPTVIMEMELVDDLLVQDIRTNV
jgi:heme-degrading monooxygenase HmoA